MTADTQPNFQPGNGASPDDGRILSIEVGGKTVAAHLEAAIAAGHVVERPDGKFELARMSEESYIGNDYEVGRPCLFLNRFMFAHVYGQRAVPIGCRNCYKVKVLPKTLRQMTAVKAIADNFDCPAKTGAEVNNEANQSLYGTYFYLLGLDKARAIYRKLRAKIDADPQLGTEVKMVVKRGCTNYEHACGPSDRYTFDPQLADVERYFSARFAPKKPERKIAKRYADAMRFLEMVRTAYRIGDDTYKDFTGGKDLFPPTVSYDPSNSMIAGDDAAREGERGLGDDPLPEK